MKAIRVGADSRPARVKEHLKAASQTNAIKTVNGGALFLLAALLGTAVSGFANADPSCMTEAEALLPIPALIYIGIRQDIVGTPFPAASNDTMWQNQSKSHQQSHKQNQHP